MVKHLHIDIQTILNEYKEPNAGLAANVKDFSRVERGSYRRNIVLRHDIKSVYNTFKSVHHMKHMWNYI